MSMLPALFRKPLLCAATLGVIFLLAGVRDGHAADAAEIEKRLDRMQQELEATRLENARLRKRVDQLEQTRASAEPQPQKGPGTAEMTDTEFRAKVAEVVRTEKPAAFVTPLGKELILKLGGYIQGQAEFGDVDAWNGRFPSVANQGNDRFRIRRTRPIISGDFAEQFEFKVMGDFTNTDGSANGQSTFSAIDIFVNWHRFPEFQVKFGQFTIPFGLEMITPDVVILTAERALVSDSLAPDRMVGLQVWGYPFEHLLPAPHNKFMEYRLGAFNGNGRNRITNDNRNFLFVGRLQLNAFKPHTVAYGDNESTSTHRDVRLSLGLDGMFEHRVSKDTQLVFLGSGGVLEQGPRQLGDGSLSNRFLFSSDYRRAAWGVDVAARYGPFDLIAEYLQEGFTPDATTATEAPFTARGYYVLGSYFLPVPAYEKTFQIIEKFDFYEPSNLAGNSRIKTLTTGLNWYIKGDDIKLMLDWLHTWSDARDREFDLVLTRLQLQF